MSATLPATAQPRQPLTLGDAIARARRHNPDARLAAVSEREAAVRVDQSRAGRLPRLDVAEAWQRGNQPVFVFGSLLAARRFADANFAIDALNHPDAISNFRSAVTADYTVFDGGTTRAAVQQAELARESATLSRAQLAADLAVRVTEAFGRVLQLEAAGRAAAAAVAAASQDVERSQQRRQAGLVTAADVLALEVHLAEMRAREISADADLRIARAQLNQVLGAPLDAVFDLVVPATDDERAVEIDREAQAVQQRSEVRQARIAEASARVARRSVLSAWLPQVAVQGGWEWNGGSFGTRAGSWAIGAEIRLNLFRGLGDVARLAAADVAISRAAIEREKTETAVRLDVRSARARLEAARARELVGRASVAGAREAQRIIRDRYESGLADVTELLRAAQALLQAESQETTARIDVLLESAALDRASGR